MIAISQLLEYLNCSQKLKKHSLDRSLCFSGIGLLMFHFLRCFMLLTFKKPGSLFQEDTLEANAKIARDVFFIG